MVIGLAGHPIKLREIEEVLRQVDSALELKKLEFSEIASDRHIAAYQALQKSVDIVILGGYYDYLFFCNHVVFEKVTGYISRNITTLLRSLLEAQLMQCDIFHVSIDGYSKKELAEAYREIGRNLAEIHVFSWYKNYPLSCRIVDEIVQFHRRNWLERGVSICMTCISVVYERLCREKIPALMIRSTAENVRLAYEKLHLEYLLRAKETSNVVLLDINVIGNKNMIGGNDEYLLNVEKLHIAELIFLFAQKLQAAVEELNLGLYLIISAASSFEQETDLFKKISLLEDMARFHYCRLCVGIGYGNSMREIQRNAQIALQKARSHNKTCAYMVHDAVNITGPIFENLTQAQSVLQEHNAHIAQQTGLSVRTIQKLQFIMERYKSNTFTVNELALIYGVSQRTMYRIVDKLAAYGYVQDWGRQATDGAGRPSRIIQINFQP